MSTTLTTTSLGTSNLRGASSRQTRNLPARTSRNARPNLRHNSLISNPASAPGQAQAAGQAAGAPPAEPYGFYPAITHFTDAITALPRDFRRHTSLLKEVDAKAWALEENLQKLLAECLHERQTNPVASAAHTLAGSVSSVAGDVSMQSAPPSVNGNVLDTASQYSSASIDSDALRRRRLYHELRNNLMQMIMPLDEKNHVINNANEELSRHTRRQDEIWPHIADDISDDTRLGSLRHWALTDLNPTKKTQAAAARGRELALAQDNEVAERSERRREAMALAKKQKTTQHLDSDADVRKVSRKATSRKDKELEDAATSSAMLLPGNPPLMNLKSTKGRLVAQKKTEEGSKKPTTPAAVGGLAMSRENSQQETSKKRKAPPAATTVARKRINAATQESPKLAHSPLVGSFAKDTHKKSPALSHAKLATGRARQNSAQSAEASNRPASAPSRRNGVTATGAELERVATATGKTPNEVRQTMRETTNAKGEKMLEEDVPDTVENRIRGGIALERSASKSSQLRRGANLENDTVGRRTASPRRSAAAAVAEGTRERNGKGKANKTSTPVVATFAEAEANESATEAMSTADKEYELAMKAKRPARPRMKDHHGLHDSLSPKGLPTKRTHKRNSYSLTGSAGNPRATKEREEEPPASDRKPGPSRANSRSTKNEPREGRNASATPKTAGSTTELVDEPDSLTSVTSDDTKPVSRRQSKIPQHANHTTTPLDVKPPPIPRPTTTHDAPLTPTGGSPAPKAETPPDHDHDQEDPDPDQDQDQDLGSPGPDVVEDPADEEEEDEDDPNEQRYCYCNGVSYGEMVACDNENCAREWFHLECTGLRSLPPARSTWYCDECKGNMVR